MVKAGSMRDRVVFQRLTECTVDDHGNPYTGWEAITNGTRWADLREQKGKDRISGGALQDRARATLRVRADSITSSITSADRVIARGITWAIKDAMQVDAKNTLVEFVIEKGVAS